MRLVNITWYLNLVTTVPGRWAMSVCQLHRFLRKIFRYRYQSEFSERHVCRLREYQGNKVREFRAPREILRHARLPSDLSLDRFLTAKTSSNLKVMAISPSFFIIVFAFIFTVHSNKIPTKINDFSKSVISKSIMSQLILGLGTASKILADDGYDDIYLDKRNNFQINRADGWTLMPREVKNSLSQYMPEEIALVGSNFVEGASLSVTKSRARQLLKDMKIDWWFDNFKSINDLGSANLIAELLIRQRQVLRS